MTARRILQLDEADFRAACAQDLLNADELLQRTHRIGIRREMDEADRRIRTLIAQMAACSARDRQRFEELDDEHDRLSRRWDECFAALYGVTPTGEPAPPLDRRAAASPDDRGGVPRAQGMPGPL